MLADQEFDELCVLRVNAMLTAEAPDLFRADVGVIAPSAFADIVELRRDIMTVPFSHLTLPTNRED